MSRKMCGYSLIECLVALSLFALASALTTQVLKQSCAQLGGASNSIDERLSIVKSATIISASLSALERTHLSQLVSISNGSSPLAPHGGGHPVTGLTGTSRPRPESDIISAVEIDPLYHARIVESTVSAQSVSVTICGARVTPKSDQFRSHLLLSVGGLCQITGSPQPTSRGCFLINGSQVRGLINGDSACPHNAYLEYRPVSREISLFIDRSGQFRLISHVGMRLLESQPITRGLRELKIKRSSPRIDVEFFDITLRGTTAKMHRFLVPAALTSEPLWNEVLL